MQHLKSHQRGFSTIEVILASVIFPMIVIGIANAFDAVRKSYTVAKQLNEVYAVLSACPEIDRALDYTSLTSDASNCSPNNTFVAEGGSGITYSYTPSFTVTDTSALAVADPLSAIPDSKVIDISVSFREGTAPALDLRMLISRNGIAQQ